MRVIECQICGVLLSQANEAELAQGILQHYGADHQEQALQESQARELVQGQSYEATDS